MTDTADVIPEAQEDLMTALPTDSGSVNHRAVCDGGKECSFPAAHHDHSGRASTSPIARRYEVNTLDQWGTYVPGRRIEIEHGPWTLGEIAGLPENPCRVRERNVPVFLTQREERSPHPLTWHSKAFGSVDAARLHLVRTRMVEAEQAGEDPRLRIPHVDSFAFDLHHGGCNDGGALADCTTQRCVDRAMDHLRAILDDADLLRQVMPS